MKTDELMIAQALEMDPILLPFAPELLADFAELGSDAETLVDVLRSLNLPQATTVVDLGSGKGAVALAIAESLGFSVVGIELFKPFVDSANVLAAASSVAASCRFVHGHVARDVGQHGLFDVAIYAALGDVLGPMDVTIGILRRWVRPGGYIIIADACIQSGGSTAFSGFENYADLQVTRQRLAVHGDRLVLERFEDASVDEDEDEEDEDEDEEEARWIRSRVTKLAREHPEYSEALLAFAAAQEDQYAYMAENLLGVVWVVQRKLD